MEEHRVHPLLCSPSSVLLYAGGQTLFSTRPRSRTPRRLGVIEKQTIGLQYFYIDCTVDIIISVFCPKAGPSLQAQEPRLQFCQRQVFHCKLRNQGCSFTRDWIGVVASRCFPHPTLSLASEQTWKDPRGTNVEVRRVDLANWALRI